MGNYSTAHEISRSVICFIALFAQLYFYSVYLSRVLLHIYTSNIIRRNEKERNKNKLQRILIDAYVCAIRVLEYCNNN